MLKPTTAEGTLSRFNSEIKFAKLTGGLAHKLKNPLAIISASAQFCLEKLKLDENLSEHLKVIYRNSQTANQIISDMLDYVGPVEPVRDRVNVNRAIHYALESLGPEVRARRIGIEISLARDLPVITGSEKALQSAFVKVLANAVLSLKEGGLIRVSTSYNADRKRVGTRIKDYGCGIAEEHLDRVFEPFFTTGWGGTGLGLSACQRIVQNHGGEIRIQSQLAAGTEVIMEFPEGE